ncbi:MAG: hypothetical protein A3K09_06855 [Nitrospinae bacterium RIFCSPLOWO2_12_FULL_47_7]|nr:MAG: hypothetical protein A3K09_06855 [Nitrospinae bacterium RIFCSPLOWO2_12_FULL_47_7]
MRRSNNIRPLTLTLFFTVFLMAPVALGGCVVIPPPIPSPYNRGVEFYDQGKLSEAIEQYQLALRQNPADTLAKYNLAVVYQDQGKLDEAIRLYQDILKTTEDANSRINLAAIHHKLGNKYQVFLELQKAINRDNPNPSSILGEYLERNNQPSEAERYYQDALRIDDKHAATHYRLGRLYLKQNHSGLEHLLKAAELEPLTPEYLEALGNEYERQNQTLEAINMLERVSVLQPDRVEIYVRLGDLYKQKNYYKEAVSRYWMALSIQNDNPAVHHTLKELFESLNKMEQDWLNNNKEQGSVAKNQ